MFLQPLLYHLKVRDHFKSQARTWDFFAAAKTRDDQLATWKGELLKNTYKFDAVADAAIYDKVNTAKEKLGLQQLPVTVYQAQFTDELNASIIFLDNEAHMVFSGRIIQLLDDNELLAVIAHELAHIKLYTMQDRELEIADRIILSIANNYNSEAAYYETARIFRLYTEIFCDRGAYMVLEDTTPVITSLVKIATGLAKVSAESYIKQATEIFLSEGDAKAMAPTHPENFIRAMAIHLWHEKKEAAEEEIRTMIEGTADLDQLDIFKQKELTALTRRLLQLFLKPKWFQQTVVLSQARQYFPDFALDEKALLDEKLLITVSKSHNSIKDYLCYLLLDFALLEGDLPEVSFGWTFQFAEDLQLKEVFDSLVRKELKLSDKKLQQHRQKSLSAYYEVKESEAEQIYE